MSTTTAPLRVPLASRETQRHLAFVILCLVWGTTWLALKLGTQAVPPALFSGIRWTIAGLLLLGWRGARGMSVAVPLRLWARIVVVGALMITVNATIQLYGLRHVGSGLASVLTSGVTPVALLAFAVLAGQERFARRQALAIALGLIGLLVLFGPSAVAGAGGRDELWGAGLILLGCLAYCAGSVVIRPAMRTLEPQLIAATTNLVGGVTLLAGSLSFEPGAWMAMGLDWGTIPWLAFLFLLLPGSLGATVIYFLLVRDWGASRAGTYAFVSPVIAVLLGAWLDGERVGLTDIIGIVLMLTAAAAALRRRPGVVPPDQPS